MINEKEGIFLKQQLDLANGILVKSSYSRFKAIIKGVFDKTSNINNGDILERLILIDSIYSTQMSKRYFGLEEMADYISTLEFKYDLNKMGEDDGVAYFLDNIYDEVEKKHFGESKNGKKQKAFSLFTKYLFFRLNSNFPIFDKLVYAEVEGREPYWKPPSTKFFQDLLCLKKLLKNWSFDDIDKILWLAAKARSKEYNLLFDDSSEFENKSGKKYKQITEYLKNFKDKNYFKDLI